MQYTTGMIGRASDDRNLFAFLKEEDGIGTIEIVLIMVVLIGLIIIFKSQLTDLLDSIFGEIQSQSMEVY